MYLIDQNIRYSAIKLDSAYKVDRKSNGKHLFYNEKKAKLGNRFTNYKKAQDSILLLRDKIDASNTKKLIQLTKKYGFPGMHRLKAKKASAYFIFVHSPQKYHSKIASLISSEYELGRISEYEKEYIFWHLKGRNGHPPRLKKDGSILH